MGSWHVRFVVALDQACHNLSTPGLCSASEAYHASVPLLPFVFAPCLFAYLPCPTTLPCALSAHPAPQFYAWEVPFAAKVQSARSQEARILRKNAFWTGIFGMVLFAGPVAVAIFCFGSYTIAGHTLSNASA